MSFILDALKKAEADRKLGEAVSLHDPAPAPAPNWVEPASASSRQGIWRMVGGALALGLLLGGWLWLSTPSPDLPPQTVPPIARPDPNRSNTAMDVAAVTSPAIPEPTRVQLPIPARPITPPPHQQVAQAGTHTTATAADKQQAEPLPASIRQQLPALTVSGAMYADVPTNRMVVINGEVFHEGDTIAPGLVLEHIALKAATLRYQGKAYLLAY